MPAPSVSVLSPPPTNYFDPGILRPQSSVKWSGGTGPFDVLHEWDTVNTFDSANLIQDSNTGATSPDTGTPPSDMGPAGTAWFYRATVTDTSDAASTVSSVLELAWSDPVEERRYLYELANVGVGFTPQDDPAGGWGPDPDAIGPDGHTRDDFRRYLYELANVGVGFYPTDTAIVAEAADGETIEFRRYLYELANVDATTPTPHIWYVFPTFGREGWEFKIIGYGFGDTQATYTGTATLDGLGLSVLNWQLIAETSADLEIDPVADIAEPVHQEIRTQVPIGGTSGLVIVCTDGP